MNTIHTRTSCRSGACFATSLLARFLPALLLLSLFVPAAHAHKVNVFAFVENGSVVVEGYFTDGKVADKADIQVFGPDGAKLVEGKADDEGIFVFDIPQVADLKISLYAGMGHRADFILPADELRAAAATTGAAMAATPATADVATAVDTAAIEAMVRQAVSEAVLPLTRNIAELNESRTMSDIIGGIGFIVGIIGVFFYLKARKSGSGSSATGS